jgi:hypothetical protein
VYRSNKSVSQYSGNAPKTRVKAMRLQLGDQVGLNSSKQVSGVIGRGVFGQLDSVRSVRWVPFTRIDMAGRSRVTRPLREKRDPTPIGRPIRALGDDPGRRMRQLAGPRAIGSNREDGSPVLMLVEEQAERDPPILAGRRCPSWRARHRNGRDRDYDGWTREPGLHAHPALRGLLVSPCGRAWISPFLRIHRLLLLNSRADRKTQWPNQKRSIGANRHLLPRPGRPDALDFPVLGNGRAPKRQLVCRSHAKRHANSAPSGRG